MKVLPIEQQPVEGRMAGERRSIKLETATGIRLSTIVNEVSCNEKRDSRNEFCAMRNCETGEAPKRLRMIRRQLRESAENFHGFS